MDLAKEDFKPGQTKSLSANAADTDGVTLFYQSLYKQRPDSEMAQRWLLQHGLAHGSSALKVLIRLSAYGEVAESG